MAILEIEVAAEEQVQAQREARLAGLSLSEWAKCRLFGPPSVAFTTDDCEVYEIPNLTGIPSKRIQQDTAYKGQ